MVVIIVGNKSWRNKKIDFDYKKEARAILNEMYRKTEEDLGLDFEKLLELVKAYKEERVLVFTEKQIALKIKEFLVSLHEIITKGDCNECRKKDCEYRPQWGEITRFNCPLWVAKEGEKE